MIVPDQIGFGRSSKAVTPYNFHDMAANSKKLLQTLGAAKVTVIGHFMGGMLAARFSARYPDIVERCVIYNPIGLSDVRWERPWRMADEAYRATMTQTHDEVYQAFHANIRRYFPPQAHGSRSVNNSCGSSTRVLSVGIGRASRWSARSINRSRISIP